MFDSFEVRVGIVRAFAEIMVTVGLQDTSEFFGTLLPHIRRSLADARIEATELLEIIEREVAQQGHRDRHLHRTLRQMPLSALLACMVARVDACWLRDRVPQWAPLLHMVCGAREACGWLAQTRSSSPSRGISTVGLPFGLSQGETTAHGWTSTPWL